MLTIYRTDTGRLSIAEAKRWILNCSPRERFVGVHRQDDGTLKAVPDEEPKSIYAAHLNEDFVANCEQLGITPRWKYRPGKTGYTGNAETDDLYTIEPDEFVRLAHLFDLVVKPLADMRTFTTIARASPIDPVLLAMDPREEVHVRESFGGSQGETRCPADQYITQLRAQLARQAENFFTVAEAAQLMADSRPGTEVKKWVRRIESAAVNGHPIVRAADDRFPLEAASAFRGYSSLVTVAELDAWLESEKVGYLFPKVAQSLDAQASAAPVPATNAIAPLQRAAAQDAAVIACLRRAGHDPLALPTNESGKPGVKAAARAALGNVGLWAGSTVFHKAWERLTRNGDIAYRT